MYFYFHFMFNFVAYSCLVFVRLFYTFNLNSLGVCMVLIIGFFIWNCLRLVFVCLLISFVVRLPIMNFVCF